ncbi:hypothetical protein PTI98_000148 [Pleurotus ostreatus]|nr:hypothetical protein PTI98_000148 [Pleurotus ostreatus]
MRTNSIDTAPVQDIVEYEVKRFNTGFLDEPKTVFQGPPTDAMDEAWSDLYERGVSYLLPDEANRLVDRTIVAPGSKVYIGGLDVFHQFHCLDMIRSISQAISSWAPPCCTSQAERNHGTPKHS